MQIDKAIQELRDSIIGLDHTVIMRAENINHYDWLFLEGEFDETLVNQTRRNSNGNIEIRTINRTMRTSSTTEYTPEQFDAWRKRLEEL